jgi:type III secretory pathway component EscV
MAEAALHPRTTRSLNTVIPVAVVGIVLVMILPIRGPLDMLISANITLSVITLIVTMYITRPVQFSVYPSLLFGPLLNEAIRTGWPLSFLGVGQRVPEDLAAASQALVSELILNR